ncbi:MAG TPA: tRNA dihydrouridine synthase DusB [Chlamydiales bacterium]|jgi:nifR3 family TIM-barrel protein|nr:tRNA dihydrouridine synthase DusB [Chlamydiales bacterium]
MKLFQLGSLALPNRVFYAPLAGCSDLPYRQMACRWRPGIVYCEMVKMDALVRHDPGTYRLLDYTIDMHPIGAQLCGSKPKLVRTAARIIEDLGFDVLDLNCGCPVDKVTKDGSGSGMLRTPDLIGEMIAEMVSSVKIPVTVKIRAGWDEEHLNAPQITQIAEKAGAQAITIHGRTRAQAYKGPANWDYIRACKQVAKNILVIGNGDVFDAESAEKILLHTGCDGVLVARGAMGKPWIAEDILRHLDGLPVQERGVLAIREALLDHFDLIIRYQPERRALLDMRRVGCWYLKRLEGVKALRVQINRSSSTAESLRAILDFPWTEVEISKDASVVGAESE